VGASPPGGGGRPGAWTETGLPAGPPLPLEIV